MSGYVETLLLADMQSLMEHAFYPVLLGVLVIASLGVPIPEDVPLLAAGAILHTHPGVASWSGTLSLALCGIMSGDLILYSLGRLWGPSVVAHKSVGWIITPDRFERMQHGFRRWGVWMVFFGRFVVGVRAVMCLTAGATRYPYWRFFLSDFSAAMIFVPVCVWLGYWSAGMLSRAKFMLHTVQGALVAAALVLIIAFIIYEVRLHRRRNPAPPLTPPPPAGVRLPD
jgi:membrane protein DedA with SNARE-associated domain